VRGIEAAGVNNGLMAVFGDSRETLVLSNLRTTFVQHRALEPFYFASPWSAELKGKRVLVVHPFKDTIEAQYAKRQQLWENPNVLPEFELVVVRISQKW